MKEKERFLAKMAECLELPSVTPDYEFRSGPDFCSLQGFAILVTLETEFDRPMMVEEFLAMRTIGDLARAVFGEAV